MPHNLREELEYDEVWTEEEWEELSYSPIDNVFELMYNVIDDKRFYDADY
jgi:hypothetical protein